MTTHRVGNSKLWRLNTSNGFLVKQQKDVIYMRILTTYLPAFGDLRPIHHTFRQTTGISNTKGYEDVPLAEKKRFVAIHQEIIYSTYSNQESSLSWPIKAKHRPALGQHNSQVGNLYTKHASPQLRALMVDVSLVDDKALKRVLLKCCQNA